jgi:hypothetical protein
MNRYDLRYYKNGRLAVEIKNRRNFFASDEKDYGGQKIKSYTDWGFAWSSQIANSIIFIGKKKYFIVIFLTYPTIIGLSDD